MIIKNALSQFMENAVGALSGAALGYIIGNTRGGYFGYKLGKMAPAYKKRKIMPARDYMLKKTALTKWRGKLKAKQKKDTGVTTQVDRVTSYYKKSMPRWKKRRWIKFSKKVNAVISKSLGTNTVLFNDQISLTISNGGSQAVGAVTVYGIQGKPDGVDELGTRDVWRIAKNDNRVLPSGLGVMAAPGKIQFKSAVLDFTFRNPNDFGLEVDVYEIGYSSDNSGQISLITLINEAVNKTTLIPGSTGSSFVLYNRGVTLFDLPNAIGAGGLKILNKRKYFLAEGGTATLQHRDSKNHWFNANDFTSQDPGQVASFSKRYMTRSFLFVAKSVVAEQEQSGTFKIGCTRKYCYGVQSQNSAFDSLNPPN